MASMVRQREKEQAGGDIDRSAHPSYKSDARCRFRWKMIMRRNQLFFAAGLSIALVIGCQMTPAPGLITCPLPVAEQTAKILDIAPLGTPRDEVIKKLDKAGIIGNFSTGDSKSTYYCDVWQQDKDERWHINVVLLFDENGILYGTRPQVPSAVNASQESPATTPADPFASPPIGKGADPFE